MPFCEIQGCTGGSFGTFCSIHREAYGRRKSPPARCNIRTPNGLFTCDLDEGHTGLCFYRRLTDDDNDSVTVAYFEFTRRTAWERLLTDEEF